jgi:hypothetical protein
VEDCPHCDGRLDWLPSESSLVHAVCLGCGQDLWAVADPAPPLPSPEESVAVRVFIRWPGGGPTHAELLALKRFLPDLRDRPITEVARRARVAAEWPLGTHPLYVARGLQWEAEREGLHVAWEAVAADTAGEH